MDVATLTLLAGIISCLIGIFTFIAGRMAKAEHNGSMETKINQALEGIESINKKLEDSTHNQHSIELMVSSHEQQLKTLFRLEKELRMSLEDDVKTREVLIDLLQTIKNER